MARLERLDQLGPVLFRRLERVLIEGGPKCGRDDRAVLPADAGERVSHEMDAAALDCGAENLGGGRLQALVVVGDDQAGAAQAAVGEGAEELFPEHLGLARLHGDAHNLSAPVKIDRHGHHGGDTDDAPGPAHLDVGGVQPEASLVAPLVRATMASVIRPQVVGSGRRRPVRLCRRKAVTPGFSTRRSCPWP